LMSNFDSFLGLFWFRNLKTGVLSLHAIVLFLVLLVLACCTFWSDCNMD
jgi:hypothetical protein